MLTRGADCAALSESGSQKPYGPQTRTAVDNQGKRS